MEKEKLKLCPFCGSDVVLTENYDRYDTEKPIYDIMCKNELCYFFAEGVVIGEMKGVKSEKELIKQWNTRAASAESLPENAGTSKPCAICKNASILKTIDCMYRCTVNGGIEKLFEKTEIGER